MICNNQDCSKFKENCNILSPTGAEFPDFYFIGHGISQEEIDSGVLFNSESSDGNALLKSILSNYGIFDRSRFGKLTGCVTEYHKFTTEELEFCANRLLYEDIVRSNPKVLVLFGAKVAEIILGDRFISLSSQGGRLLSCKILGKDFKVILTYSPDYVISSGNEDSDEENLIYTKFVNDLMYALKVGNDEVADLSRKNLVTALSFDEFDEYCKNHIDNSSIVAYDIETNAQPVHSAQFRIIGFSLSSDVNSGVYVVRNSLEYAIPNEDWKRIEERLLGILKSKEKIIVHNSMYEVPATQNVWNYEIQNYEDTLVMSRLLLGGRSGAGLKLQCQINLGYPEWEADLNDYKDAIDALRVIMKPTPSGKSREWFDKLVEFGNLQMLEEYCEKAIEDEKNNLDVTDLFEFEIKEKYKDIENNKHGKCAKAIESIKDILRKYYEDSEFNKMLSLVGLEVISLVESGNFGFLPYSSIPMKLLSKYGAIDAVGTFELYGVLSKRLTEESTVDVDLWKGYEIMKSQFDVAISMEMNGLYWNDKVATEEDTWFRKEAVQSIKNLFLSGFLDNKLFDNGKEEWTKYLLENNPDDIIMALGEKFVPSKNGIKRESGGREIRFNKLPEIFSDSYWEKHRDDVIFNMKRMILADADELDHLKWTYVYNPNSPKQEDFLTSILVTPEIRIAAIMYSIKMLMDEPSFKLENYGSDDVELFSTILDAKSMNAARAEYNESDEGKENPLPKITNREIFESFAKVISEPRGFGEDVKEIIKFGSSYRLTDGRDGSIIHLSELYNLAGYDPDLPEDTWSPEFFFLYNYRIYKKCFKMISTYIVGSKVGRGTVWEVSREDIDSNSKLPRRLNIYTGSKSDDREYIMQPSYGVCTAGSFRWKSGQHTIPATSTVKNIYTSRYKGGIIMMPDFSQQELRAMAGLSKCQALIDAFRSGADIHKLNASKMFNKPLDEVTSLERRYAKQFSFSILYGATPEGAGKDYLNGDVERAREIFDSFYAAYPEVKDWINKKHKEMLTTGRVSCENTGMFIKLSVDDAHGDVEKAKREAQNMPCQSSSSNIAGYILSKVNRYIKDHNMWTKTILFIHDSLEFDVHPSEFLRFSEYLGNALITIPEEEFGLPCKADLALGPSLGEELEASDLNLSEDKNSGELTIEGDVEYFDKLIYQFRQTYKLVEYEDLEEPENVYLPKKSIFMPKTTVSKRFGTTTQNIKRRVKLIYE